MNVLGILITATIVVSHRGSALVIPNPLPNELGVSRGALPTCPILDPFAYIRDQKNCGMFYRCFWGKAVAMSGCTPGLVFSNVLNICVHQGTVWDDCSIPGIASDPKYLTPQQRCNRGDTLFAHPTECAMFYNCSLVYRSRPRYGEQHLDECPYPQLFNSSTLQCEDFSNVNCGARNEPKSGCEYKQNVCQRAHCIPCWVFYPSCINATDGLYYDSKRPWTPNYVECKSERSIRTAQCPQLNGVTQIFSPDLRQCVSIYDVPRQYNGLRPNCMGKKDRLYAEENNRCNVYIQCTNQQYGGYGVCPDGSNFDPLTQTCKPLSELCPPCGTNTTACGTGTRPF